MVMTLADYQYAERLMAEKWLQRQMVRVSEQ